MIKMNCVLLTACIVLFAFSSSGYALRCYHCENSPSLCKTNSTCLSNEDTCLQMRFGRYTDLQTSGSTWQNAVSIHGKETYIVNSFRKLRSFGMSSAQQKYLILKQGYIVEDLGKPLWVTWKRRNNVGFVVENCSFLLSHEF
ncbi:UNVERIFIED_CONTAM: hypothetical protein H355_008333 [Colinus virginianus]|nr:hypothetical protein H355_008333 [Colinus virginianus]